MNTPSDISVLIVDDEPGLAPTLRRVLEFGGYTVRCVDSGQQALEQLRSHEFDVVITDIFLPDVDGPLIIGATRKQRPNARIIAMSGGGAYMSSPDALNVATKLGADSVLMKPFTPAVLLEAVKSALQVRPT